MSAENISMSERASQLEGHIKPMEREDPPIAPILLARARSLEKEMKKDAVRSSLDNRLSVEEMEEKGLLNSNIAPSLVSRAKSIEKEMKKDNLHHELDERHSAKELEDRGILHPSDSNILAGRMVELEHNMKKDAVHRGLENRPDRAELASRDNQVSNPIAAVASQLEHNMKKDAISRGLRDRPTVDNLVEQANPELAPALRANARSLQHNMTKDQLRRYMKSRPEEEELVNSGITLGHKMASSLQSTEKQLEMEIKKNTIDQSLYQRPTPSELKKSHPAVYDSLSEEAKENTVGREQTALFRVYASLLQATAEQLMTVGKLTSQQYDEIIAIINGKDEEKRNVLLNAADEYKKHGKYEQYEERILSVL